MTASDGLNVVALAAVVAECLLLGWLSSVDWPPTSATFWVARWALRLLVGATLIPVAELLLALTGIGFHNLLLDLALAAALALGLRFVARDDRPRHKSFSMERRERVGWLCAAVVFLAAVVRSLLVAESGWDAYSHWGLRAQAYALAGTVINAGSEHEYYPPLVPLLEAWLYLHRGLISLDLAKTIWAFVGSAFGVCLAWHLRLSLRQWTWLAPWLAVGIVLVTPALLEGFSSGQADLPLTGSLTLCSLAVWQWSRSRSRAWLLQAGVLGAAAALSKLEGSPRLGVVVVALAIEALLARRTALLRPAVLLVIVAASSVGVWSLAATMAGIGSNTEHLGRFQPEAIAAVALTLAATFGGVRTGGGLMITALTWLLAGRRIFCPKIRLLTLIMLGQLAATLLAFLVSDTNPAIEVRTSATRLFEQWLPLALFASVVALDLDEDGLRATAEVGVASYNRPGR